MENATKALLIAAAVLVAILIISLGLVIYNMASETIEGAGDLSEYQIQQHNEKFDKYVGNNQTGSNVNAMLKTVFNYNLVQDSKETMIEVVDNTGDADIDPDSLPGSQPSVPTTKRYNVAPTYEGAMITTLTISSVGS